MRLSRSTRLTRPCTNPWRGYNLVKSSQPPFVRARRMPGVYSKNSFSSISVTIVLGSLERSRYAFARRPAKPPPTITMRIGSLRAGSGICCSGRCCCENSLCTLLISLFEVEASCRFASDDTPRSPAQVRKSVSPGVLSGASEHQLLDSTRPPYPEYPKALAPALDPGVLVPPNISKASNIESLSSSTTSRSESSSAKEIPDAFRSTGCPI
mmetsp:Transcript_11055/g.21599  ORF Transcript_11055/g.21599 Transcript_11055/m.21599 type:complete len:211 (-) Transcript_11055:327-959(-)